MKQYDCIVIGSGAAGLTVARGMAGVGKKVAIIDRTKHLGGDCTNVGCVPSKRLLYLAHTRPQVGLIAALTDTRSIRDEIRATEDIQQLSKEGIDVYIGECIPKNNHIVEINGEELYGKRFVIATGAEPIELSVTGVPPEKIYTNETIFEVTTNIKSLILVGGGYIGAELAEAFQLLGVSVTMITNTNKLVPREEPETSQFLYDYLTKIGVRILTEASITSATATTLTVTRTDNSTVQLEYDAVLSAIGRTPRKPQSLIEKWNLVFDRGFVVDRYNRTRQKHIYAIGDSVSGNLNFTHVANDDGRRLVRNILFPYIPAGKGHKPVPSVVYTRLEIARVGQTEKEAIEQFKSTTASVLYPLNKNDRDHLGAHAGGFVKLIYRKLTGTVLGATIVSEHAGEMIPRLVAAVAHRESIFSISSDIFPYPTYADAIKRAADIAALTILKNIRSELYTRVRGYTRQLTTLFLWVLIIGVYAYTRVLYDMTTFEIAQRLYVFLMEHVAIGGLIFITVYALRSLVLFPATLLTIISGIVFGPVWGSVYALFGANISAAISYTIGKSATADPDAQSSLSGIRDYLSGNAFQSVLIGRFIFLPFDIMNFASGVLRIPYMPFALATAIGILPGTIAFVLAGASLDAPAYFKTMDIVINSTVLYASLFLISVSFLVSYFLKK